MRTSARSIAVWCYGVSLAAHVGGVVALVGYETPRPPPPVVVKLKAVEKPKPKPKPPPPPAVDAAPQPAPPPKPAPPKPAAKPATPPPAAAPAAAAPSFGLALGNAGSGPGGIAVPVGDPSAPRVRQAAAREVSASPAGGTAEPSCVEGDVKAKPLSLPRPTYTDEARAASVEGKVRIEITLDAAGVVTAATVLAGLGHGLDESALAAVRETRFEPARRCGAAVSSTFVLSVRFTL